MTTYHMYVQDDAGDGRIIWETDEVPERDVMDNIRMLTEFIQKESTYLDEQFTKDCVIMLEVVDPEE